MKKTSLNLISKIMFVITLLVGVSFMSLKTVNAAETLEVKSFEIWNKGDINGYDAGFQINGATFDNASSIVISLYSNDTLLQTNTAIEGKIKGTEFLTPFDIYGTFNYVKDGYFVNKRESEYGKNLKPTKIIATVILSDGNIITTTSTKLSNQNTYSSGQVLGVNSYHFTQKIKVGSEGNEVKELQKFLNGKGYNSGTPDGKFGPKTKGAVIQFQLANNLEGDSIVGPITRAYLNK